MRFEDQSIDEIECYKNYRGPKPKSTKLTVMNPRDSFFNSKKNQRLNVEVIIIRPNYIRRKNRTSFTPRQKCPFLMEIRLVRWDSRLPRLPPQFPLRFSRHGVDMESRSSPPNRSHTFWITGVAEQLPQKNFEKVHCNVALRTLHQSS